MAEENNAAHEFDRMEDRFNDKAAQNLTALALGMTIADGAAKDLAFKRAVEIMGAPNETITLKEDRGDEGTYAIELTVPAITLTDTRILVIDEVNASLDQTIHSTATDESTTEAHGDFKADIHAGWGPISIGVELSGGASTSSTKKRTSDRTATSHYDLKMRQSDPPEGIGMITDAANRFLSSRLQIEEARAKHNFEKELADATAGKALPPTDTPTPAN